MKKSGIKKTYNFFELFDQFISESQNGKRLQKNGKRNVDSTIEKYYYHKKLLVEFSAKKNFELRLRNVIALNKRELLTEKNYWKKFYKKFTDFLYYDKGFYDNYVGTNIKTFRVFFNYLNNNLGLSIGSFHNQFYVRHEKVPIVVLLPEQLNFLIYDKEFENSLNPQLKRTKDIFVFGCTVALRISDLLSLSRGNLEIINDQYYLKAISKKTKTFTRIKLPRYAIDIILKYSGRHKTLLPPVCKSRLNVSIKQLIEKAGWTDPYYKTRERRGITTPLISSKTKTKQHRFCDMITSHTMRRTAITTLLCLGMSEHLVRKISGHTYNSTEFFRYVEFSQTYMDSETEKIFEQLEKRKFLVKQ